MTALSAADAATLARLKAGDRVRAEFGDTVVEGELDDRAGWLGFDFAGHFIGVRTNARRANGNLTALTLLAADPPDEPTGKWALVTYTVGGAPRWSVRSEEYLYADRPWDDSGWLDDHDWARILRAADPGSIVVAYDGLPEDSSC